MLLVKPKESKNSNKNRGLYAFAGAILSTALPLHAQTGNGSLASTDSLLSIFLSLLVVIAVIVAMAMIFRRFNFAQTGQGQLKIVASMMVGTKERIAVIQVGDEQYLIGATSHNISSLGKLEQPLPEKSPVTSMAGVSGSNFQQKLIQAMADRINPDRAKHQPATEPATPSTSGDIDDFSATPSQHAASPKRGSDHV